MASAWRSACRWSTSATGVSDTNARRRASSAASARWASCSADTSSSSRSWRSRAATWVRRRSTNDLDMGSSLNLVGRGRSAWLTSPGASSLPAGLHLGMVVPVHQGGGRGPHPHDRRLDADRARRRRPLRHPAPPGRAHSGRPDVAAPLRSGGHDRQHRAVHAAGVGRAAHHVRAHGGAQRLDATVHGPVRGHRTERAPAAGADRRARPGHGGRSGGRRARRLRPRGLVDGRRTGRHPRRRRLRHRVRVHAAPPRVVPARRGRDRPACDRRGDAVPPGCAHVDRRRRVAHPYPVGRDPGAGCRRHGAGLRPQLPGHRRARSHQGIAGHIRHPGRCGGRRHRCARRAVRVAARGRRPAHGRRHRRGQRQAAGARAGAHHRPLAVRHRCGTPLAMTDPWGIDDGYWDVQGVWHETPPDTAAALRSAMGAGAGPDDGPSAGRPVWVVRAGAAEPLLGPCELALEDGAEVRAEGSLPPDLPIGYHDLRPLDGGPVTRLIVSPGRCHRREDLRAWLVTVQLPACRSATSWGIGDLRDLRTIGAWAADRGAGMVGVSPLHAPLPIDRVEPSPYFPSSRRWSTPLALRIEDVPGAGGDATVEDLAEHHGAGWRAWPAEHRHPTRAGVASFATSHAERVAYWAWVQFLIDEQLRRAEEPLPLLTDLAIGVDPDGADAWTMQDLLASGVRVGAPPDEFNRAGQDWGLPPFVPHALRDAAYQPVASLWRAAMGLGGGLRIDHVMGLSRLYWIPPGGGPADGAYVRYRGDEMLAVLTIESVRSGAVVVGEDLGTVEDEVRHALGEAGVLSYRLAWFEGETPEHYPAQALAAVTTHDLPTVAGVWAGDDAPDQPAPGVEPDEGALEPPPGPLIALTGLPPDAPVDDVIVALHARLAASPSELVAATLEDALGLRQRPNLPGTSDQRPNWSLTLPVPLDDALADPLVTRVVEALRR